MLKTCTAGITLACFGVFLGVVSSEVQAQDLSQVTKLKPRVEGNIRAGQDRSIYMSEMWVPLHQDQRNKNVVFGDFRLMGDNQSANEFNAGLGYRQMTTLPHIGKGVAGGMIWYDRRNTAFNNTFNQITLGGEWLAEDWDVRLNGYIPMNDSASFTRDNPNGSGAALVGNQIVVNTNQDVEEEALAGLDLEFGVRVPYLDAYTDSTRVYAAGFHFEGDRAEDVTGWRTRVASDITSDIQVGARFQHDDVRGSQGFLEATVRFPFNMKKSYRDHGLYARMDESPERDIDIVSNLAVINDGNNIPLLNATTGDTQNIIHVDNTADAGGDGSNEARFDTLLAAQNAATTNDIIYVHRGDGSTTGQDAGIIIDDAGQQLIGSGVDLNFDASQFTTANGKPLSGNLTNLTLIAKDPNGAPNITNTGGNGVDITADNVIVSGLEINSTNNNGINLSNSNSVIINNNTVENVGEGGIIANYSIDRFYTLEVNNNQILNTTGDGINLDLRNDSSANVYINNNTIDTTGANGIFTAAYDDANLNTNIKSNTFENNNNIGVFYDLRDNSTTNVTFDDNTISTVVTLNGFQVRARNNATANNLKIVNNVFDNIRSQAIIIDTVGGTNSTIENFLVQNNSITQSNIGFGVRVRGSGGGVLSGIIKDNFITKQQSGIYIDSENSSVVTAKIENNTVIDNNNHGIIIDDNSSGILTADLGGGTLSSLGQNTIMDNLNEEVEIDSDGTQVKAENNWWGSITGLAGGETALRDGSTIDAVPFLTERPE